MVEMTRSFDPGTDVYIGRESTWAHLVGIHEFPWGNPYKKGEKDPETGKRLTKEEALALYEDYILQSTELRDKLPNLVGKNLLCWRPAEGEVLIKLLKELGYDAA